MASGAVASISKAVGADARHRADRRTDEARRVEGADVGPATVREVVGRPAVEAPLRIRREQEFGATRRGPGEPRALGEERVEQPAVVAGHVLDVGRVLVAALDLEARHAGVDERAQVVALVVVLHRQQVPVEGDDAPGLVLERVRQAAGLRAVAAVGAASGVRVADVALAREGDAQRTVDEVLDDDVAGQRVAHRRDLVQSELAREHELRETGIGEEARLRGRADVALRRRVQLDRRQVELQQSQVLDDQRVDAGVPALLRQPTRGLQLVVVQDRVQRHEDSRVEAVGEGNEVGDLVHRVARAVPGAERRPADVDGVGAVQHGLAPDRRGLGRGEELETRGSSRHRSRVDVIGSEGRGDAAAFAWRTAAVAVGVVRRSVMRRRPVPARRRAPRPRSPRRAGRGGRPRRRHRTGWARSRRGRRDRECTASRTPAGRTARPAR